MGTFFSALVFPPKQKIAQKVLINITDRKPVPLGDCAKSYVSTLTLTYSGESLRSQVLSGVCSKNGLIASEVAVNDPVALARDDCHNNRTKIKVVELYLNQNSKLSSLVMRPGDGFDSFISVSLTEVQGRKIGRFWPLKLAKHSSCVP